MAVEHNICARDQPIVSSSRVEDGFEELVALCAVGCRAQSRNTCSVQDGFVFMTELGHWFKVVDVLVGVQEEVRLLE